MPGRLAAFTCVWMEMNRHRSRSGCGKVGSVLLSTFPQPVFELLRFFTNLSGSPDHFYRKLLAQSLIL